jgi:hypothetical protein
VTNITKAHRVQADVGVNDQGSIFLVRFYSAAANEWLAEHLPEDAQFWHGKLVVEHRFIDNIIAGLQGDGLTVEFE